MDTTASVAKNGTVLAWNVGGAELIYPEQAIGSERRGGIPLCVPMFSVQQRPIPGCELPLHGLLLYEDPSEPDTLFARDTWSATHAFPTTEQFAWDFVVVVQLALAEYTLTHTLTVKRAASCTNEQEMPLSLGFHPYFKTYGADFSFVIGDTTFDKATLPSNIIDSAFAPLTPGESAVLTTARGTIRLTPGGFDEYCLWTDAIERYFCIEPIYQYREFGLPGTGLAPGEEKVVAVEMEFTPA